MSTPDRRRPRHDSPQDLLLAIQCAQWAAELDLQKDAIGRQIDISSGIADVTVLCTEAQEFVPARVLNTGGLAIWDVLDHRFNPKHQRIPYQTGHVAVIGTHKLKQEVFRLPAVAMILSTREQFWPHVEAVVDHQRMWPELQKLGG